MKPPPFDYHRPGSVAEAIELLDGLEDAKVIAGGQSLVPLMNYRLAAPAHLVDISRLDELGTITVDDGAVVVGAADGTVRSLRRTHGLRGTTGGFPCKNPPSMSL